MTAEKIPRQSQESAVDEAALHFHVDRQRLVVYSDASGDEGTYTTQTAATQRCMDLNSALTKRLDQERAERERLAREQRDNDPAAIEQRAIKKAYKVLERDPFKRAWWNLIAKPASKARENTQASYKQVMRGIGKCMSWGSTSDQQLHDELSKTAGQRQTAPASRANPNSGEADRLAAKVLELTLAGMTQAAISKELDVNVRTVGRHQKALRKTGHIV
jgi:hypothetical protein